MSAEETNRRPMTQDDGSRNQPPGRRGTDSASTVSPRPRGRRVSVHLSHDLPTTQVVLETFAATLPRGLPRDVVVSLLVQLSAPDLIEQGVIEQRARELHEAWRIVVDQERRERKRTWWSENRFRREWDTYLDPNTGRPHELPYDWWFRVNDLQGLPWFVVRDQIHDTLTGSGARTFEAVIRRCRRTSRRLRARAERVADVIPHPAFTRHREAD